MQKQESATDFVGEWLIFRGALGGAFGAPLLLAGFALDEKLRTGYIAYGGGLHLAGLPLFMIIGALLGAVIGGLIWLAVKTGGSTRIPAIIRVIIGVAFILIALVVLQVLRGNENGGPYPPRQWLVAGLLYVVFFGALPGVAARPRIRKDEMKTRS